MQLYTSDYFIHVPVDESLTFQLSDEVSKREAKNKKKGTSVISLVAFNQILD